MSWKVAHACVRGSAHLRSGLPNQDAAQCVVVPGERGSPALAIAAVSDGHGGVRHFRSQIGSSLAVSTAVDVLQGFLSQRSFESGVESIGADDILALEQTIVDRWFAAVSVDLENHPITGEELAELEKGDGMGGRTAVETLPILAYGATLLAAAAIDSLVLYLQLGDGEILAVDHAGQTTRPLPADARLLGNQTTSLCQPEAWREFRVAWVTAADMPALILLSTDGYVNSFRSDDDFLKIGSDYLEIIREQGIATLAEELPDILKEATEQGSGDDITLAILLGELRKNAAETNGAPVKPRISGESRSALIEQLKARHSSQHHRLDELSSRLEETRQDNRRLRWMVLLLVLIVAGAGLYYFRGAFHSSAPKPGVKPTPVEPHSTPETSPPPAKTAKAALSLWRLTLIRPPLQIALKKGTTIPCDQIAPCEKTDTEAAKSFAEVAWDPKTKQMELINHSGLTWKVKPRNQGKRLVIGKSDHVVLGAEVEDITFKDGVKGVIAPAEAADGSDGPGRSAVVGDQTQEPAPTDPSQPETE